MKRFNPRIVIGTLLIVAGGLGFLQAFGILRDASDVFWGIVSPSFDWRQYCDICSFYCITGLQ